MERSIRLSRSHVYLIIAAMLVCTFAFLLIVPQAHAARAYGQLCSRYESNDNPACIDPDCAYGAYQMSTGNAYLFAVWLKGSSNTTTASYGAELVKAYNADNKDCGTNFDTAWKAIAKTASTAFFNLQYTYVKQAYYAPAVSMWQSAVPGFKVSNYSYALRNVIFSTAVQHGPTGSANYIFVPAMTTLGGYQPSYSEGEIIRAIYAERARLTGAAPGSPAYKISSISSSLLSTYASFDLQDVLVGKYLAHFYSSSSAVQVGVYIRHAINEPTAAMGLLYGYTGSFTGIPHTGGVITYSNITDKTYTQSVTPAYYSVTGYKIASASTSTVPQVYTMSGTSWKSPCGKSYTIHSLGYYYVKATTLNLRSSANISASVLKTLSQNKVVKVTKAIMASDGFWWGKLTVGDQTGYVRMVYLSHIGTASGIHKYVDGRCIYCGATKTQISHHGTGTYTLAKDACSYSAAYMQSIKKTSFATGDTAKVAKVVVNRYGDWWGKLSNGTYIKMTRFR